MKPRAVATDNSRLVGWVAMHYPEMQAQRKKAKRRGAEVAREGRLDIAPDLAETVERHRVACLKVDGNGANTPKREEVAAGIVRRTFVWGTVVRGDCQPC